MPIHQSVMKNERQTVRRRERNKMVLSKLKTLIKKFTTSLESKNTEEIKLNLREVTSCLDKASLKHVIHHNAAARKVSRLTSKANKALVQP